MPNLVVLRSTSKFYGIAATRAGMAWCAEPDRLKRLSGGSIGVRVLGVSHGVSTGALRIVAPRPDEHEALPQRQPR